MPISGKFLKVGLAALALLGLGLGSISSAQQNPVLIDGDVPIERGFTREVVVGGLERPWAAAWLPGGEVLVTERPGRLRLVEIAPDGRGKLHPTPVASIPAVFARGQGGLLDIRLHPEFTKNRYIYLSYAHGSRRGNHTRVARAIYEVRRVFDWQVIFETNTAKPGTQHFGSRLCWLPDGTLLISVGDGGNPPLMLNGRLMRENAQDRSNQLGSVVRINDDGTIPADNPFADAQGTRLDIFSYGHRNIQGLTYDTTRNTIWATEHGALGGDELNRLRAGNNYGWPVVTYSREYFDGSKISPHVSMPGTVPPLAVWLTAIAPSGLTLYTGNKFPAWKGDLFAGALIKQSVRHITLDAAGNVMGQREMRFGARVRDVRQAPDGFLYVLTDDPDGELIRLKPAKGGDTAP